MSALEVLGACEAVDAVGSDDAKPRRTVNIDHVGIVAGADAKNQEDALGGAIEDRRVRPGRRMDVEAGVVRVDDAGETANLDGDNQVAAYLAALAKRVQYRTYLPG